MKNDKKIRVYLNDHMVLLGFGLAAIYWVLDSVLFIFLNYDVNIFYRFFGINLSEVWTRLIVTCLFIIFGSHAQYTINKRRLVESELQKSEEKYRTIIESIEDGYFELDHSGRFTFFNDAMCLILGVSQEELNNLRLMDMVHSEHATDVARVFQDIRETGVPVKTYDWVVVNKFGEKRYLDASISPILDRRHTVTGFRGIIRDVTQRRVEDALKQEKMAAEAASRAKSEFLANMSHEIRTPLNSIIGLVELMMETKLSNEQRDDLEIVTAAAYALLAVINDILDFSKIEAGKLELESTDFDLRALIGDAMKIMAPKAHEKHLELAYRIDRRIPAQLVGDPARLRQVIINLIGNAIKFTESGEIILQVAQLNEGAGDVNLHCSVRDTGIGVPPEKQKTIFGAFEQADGSTTRKYGGTGLGLAVSSQLMELMGGRLWVDSGADGGSDFQFEVPCGLSQDIRQEEPIAEGEKLQGMTALVMDDNTASRNILTDMLSEWDVAAEQAVDMETACTSAQMAADKGKPYQIYLIDAEMPEDDGIGFAQWLIESGLPDYVSILMVPYSRLRAEINASSLPVNASISKPIRMEELLNALLIASDFPMAMGTTSADTAETEKERERALRILVVEDTPFNQKFILRLLGRWGHTADVADNGRIALELMAPDKYDVILMDVQMPEMDGFEATEAIRERQYAEGWGHIPIIAMTAHAMKGDQERCLEVGMDAYVSKPISSDLLRETINSLVVEANETSPANTPAPVADDVINKESMLRAFDHDWEFFQEAVDMFLEDYPPMVDSIRQAVQETDAENLKRNAHALKGMLGNFQATTAAKAALILEEMGRENSLDGADEAEERLSTEVARVEQTLRAMLEDSN